MRNPGKRSTSCLWLGILLTKGLLTGVHLCARKRLRYAYFPNR